MSDLKTRRSSNIELLRIISMLMIVASHAMQHAGVGSWQIITAPISVNLVASYMLGSYGQLGVILFIIISSWFLCDKNEIHVKKAIYLYLQTMLCSVAIFFFVKIFKFEPVGIKEFIKALLTPIYSGYWFIKSYLIFYLLVPFIQEYLRKTEEKQIEKLFITLTIFIPFLRFFFFSEEFGNVGDFIYIFIAVYYLKKRPENFLEKHAKILGTTLLFLMWLSMLSFNLFAHKINLPEEKIKLITHIFANRNIFLMILAMCVFYIFKNFKIGYSKIINAVAGTTLGVYIFHENPLFCSYGGNGIRETALLFEYCLKIGLHFENDKFYPFYFVTCVLGVFVICSALEFSRQFLCKFVVFCVNRTKNKNEQIHTSSGKNETINILNTSQ